MAEPPVQAALLVDFENLMWEVEKIANWRTAKTTAGEAVIRALSEFKRTVLPEWRMSALVGRSYADFERPECQEVLHSLAMLSIDPIYVVSSPGKNSADLELSLAAQEILLTRPEVSHFIIAGGDRDYIPVVKRIKERGRGITVVGLPQSTSGDLRAIVGHESFFDLTPLLPKIEVAVAVAPPTPQAGPSSANSIAGPPAGSDEGVEAAAAVAVAEPLDEGPLSKAQLRHCLSVMVRAINELNAFELYLVPFMKNYLNDEFVAYTNEQRKAMIQKLADEGAIKLVSRPRAEGLGNYTSIVVNSDHPWLGDDE